MLTMPAKHFAHTIPLNHSSVTVGRDLNVTEPQLIQNVEDNRIECLGVKGLEIPTAALSMCLGPLLCYSGSGGLTRQRKPWPWVSLLLQLMRIKMEKR